MREFNMDRMVVVYKGDEWKHDMIPCSKAAIPFLEKNERIVSWLRPAHGGVCDEIPAIIYRTKYYSLSLRMQKAIYRHIRLRKGFKNVEMMDGVNKLRIPDVLLREKIRTQSRFEAMRKHGRRAPTPSGGEVPNREVDAPQQPTNTMGETSEGLPPSSCATNGRRKRKVMSHRPNTHHNMPTTYSNTVSAKIRDVLASLIAQYSSPVDHHQLTSFVRSSCMTDLVAEYMTHEDIPGGLQSAGHRSAAIAAFTEAYDAYMEPLPRATTTNGPSPQQSYT